MLNSERIFKIKVRLGRTVEQVERNFVYISNLRLKSFAWKRDFLISSKLQTS